LIIDINSYKLELIRFCRFVRKTLQRYSV